MDNLDIEVIKGSLAYRLAEIAGEIIYKPNTGFRIGTMGNGMFLQHWQEIEDCQNSPGPITRQNGRKFYISEHATDSEIIQTALLAVIQFEEHEAREWFYYKGERIFNPHIAPEALMRVCGEQDARR